MSEEFSHVSSEAQSYLSENKISELFKYFATELIVHRPEDPLTFLFDLIQNPVSKVGYEYSPELVASLLDESRGQDMMETTPRVSSTTAAFSKLVISMRRIASELEPSLATQKIIEETCNLLNCERATLFTVDGDTNELILHVANSGQEIRLPVGKGIAGTVAATGESLIIDDAYSDDRFDPTFDKQSGFKTRTVLCSPLKDFNTNEVYAVIQAINKHGTAFTLRDTHMLETLGTQAVITLQNAVIYDLAATEQARTCALVELLTALKSGLNISSLIFSIKQRTLEIVNATRSTFFLVDNAAQKIWSIQGEVNVVLPMDQGIVGACAMSGQVVNIHNAYEDERFDNSFDEKSGFVTRTILCVPMLSPSDGAVIAVLQVINKNNDEIFDDRDEHLLEIVLSIASPIIHSQKAFHFVGDERENKYNEGMVKDLAAESSANETLELSQLAECDEEDDEDDE